MHFHCHLLQELAHLHGLEIANRHCQATSKPCGVIFAQEISDFDKRASLLNDCMDREMGVQRPDPVTEAQCDTLDLVLCVSIDNASDGQVLPVSPPFITPEPFFLS